MHCLAAYIVNLMHMCVYSFWAGWPNTCMCSIILSCSKKYIYIYLLSSEVIVSHHLEHRIWIHHNLHLRWKKVFKHLATDGNKDMFDMKNDAITSWNKIPLSMHFFLMDFLLNIYVTEFRWHILSGCSVCAHSTTCAVPIEDIVRATGCLVVAAQWQSWSLKLGVLVQLLVNDGRSLHLFLCHNNNNYV